MADTLLSALSPPSAAPGGGVPLLEALSRKDIHEAIRILNTEGLECLHGLSILEDIFPLALTTVAELYDLNGVTGNERPYFDFATGLWELMPVNERQIPEMLTTFLYAGCKFNQPEFVSWVLPIVLSTPSMDIRSILVDRNFELNQLRHSALYYVSKNGSVAVYELLCDALGGVSPYLIEAGHYETLHVGALAAGLVPPKCSTFSEARARRPKELMTSPQAASALGAGVESNSRGDDTDSVGTAGTGGTAGTAGGAGGDTGLDPPGLYVALKFERYAFLGHVLASMNTESQLRVLRSTVVSCLIPLDDADSAELLLRLTQQSGAGFYSHEDRERDMEERKKKKALAASTAAAAAAIVGVASATSNAGDNTSATSLSGSGSGSGSSVASSSGDATPVAGGTLAVPSNHDAGLEAILELEGGGIGDASAATAADEQQPSARHGRGRRTDSVSSGLSEATTGSSSAWSAGLAPGSGAASFYLSASGRAASGSLAGGVAAVRGTSESSNLLLLDEAFSSGLVTMTPSGGLATGGGNPLPQRTATAGSSVSVGGFSGSGGGHHYHHRRRRGHGASTIVPSAVAAAAFAVGRDLYSAHDLICWRPHPKGFAYGVVSGPSSSSSSSSSSAAAADRDNSNGNGADGGGSRGSGGGGGGGFGGGRRRRQSTISLESRTFHGLHLCFFTHDLSADPLLLRKPASSSYARWLLQVMPSDLSLAATNWFRWTPPVLPPSNSNNSQLLAAYAPSTVRHTSFPAAARTLLGLGKFSALLTGSTAVDSGVSTSAGSSGGGGGGTSGATTTTPIYIYEGWSGFHSVCLAGDLPTLRFLLSLHPFLTCVPILRMLPPPLPPATVAATAAGSAANNNATAASLLSFYPIRLAVEGAISTHTYALAPVIAATLSGAQLDSQLYAPCRYLFTVRPDFVKTLCKETGLSLRAFKQGGSFLLPATTAVAAGAAASSSSAAATASGSGDTAQSSASAVVAPSAAGAEANTAATAADLSVRDGSVSLQAKAASELGLGSSSAGVDGAESTRGLVAPVNQSSSASSCSSSSSSGSPDRRRRRGSSGSAADSELLDAPLPTLPLDNEPLAAVVVAASSGATAALEVEEEQEEEKRRERRRSHAKSIGSEDGGGIAERMRMCDLMARAAVVAAASSEEAPSEAVGTTTATATVNKASQASEEDEEEEEVVVFGQRSAKPLQINVDAAQGSSSVKKRGSLSENKTAPLPSPPDDILARLSVLAPSGTAPASGGSGIAGPASIKRKGGRTSHHHHHHHHHHNHKAHHHHNHHLSVRFRPRSESPKSPRANASVAGSLQAAAAAASIQAVAVANAAAASASANDGAAAGSNGGAGGNGGLVKGSPSFVGLNSLVAAAAAAAAAAATATANTRASPAFGSVSGGAGLTRIRSNLSVSGLSSSAGVSAAVATAQLPSGSPLNGTSTASGAGGSNSSMRSLSTMSGDGQIAAPPTSTSSSSSNLPASSPLSRAAAVSALIANTAAQLHKQQQRDLSRTNLEELATELSAAAAVITAATGTVSVSSAASGVGVGVSITAAETSSSPALYRVRSHSEGSVAPFEALSIDTKPIVVGQVGALGPDTPSAFTLSAGAGGSAGNASAGHIASKKGALQQSSATTRGGRAQSPSLLSLQRGFLVVGNSIIQQQQVNAQGQEEEDAGIGMGIDGDDDEGRSAATSDAGAGFQVVSSRRERRALTAGSSSASSSSSSSSALINNQTPHLPKPRPSGVGVRSPPPPAAAGGPAAASRTNSSGKRTGPSGSSSSPSASNSTATSVHLPSSATPGKKWGTSPKAAVAASIAATAVTAVAATPAKAVPAAPPGLPLATTAASPQTQQQQQQPPQKRSDWAPTGASPAPVGASSLPVSLPHALLPPLSSAASSPFSPQQQLPLLYQPQVHAGSPYSSPYQPPAATAAFPTQWPFAGSPGAFPPQASPYPMPPQVAGMPFQQMLPGSLPPVPSLQRNRVFTGLFCGVFPSFSCSYGRVPARAVEIPSYLAASVPESYADTLQKLGENSASANVDGGICRLLDATVVGVPGAASVVTEVVEEAPPAISHGSSEVESGAGSAEAANGATEPFTFTPTLRELFKSHNGGLFVVPQRVPWIGKRGVLHSLVSAVAFLHSQGLSHGALSPETASLFFLSSSSSSGPSVRLSTAGLLPVVVSRVLSSAAHTVLSTFLRSWLASSAGEYLPREVIARATAAAEGRPAASGGGGGGQDSSDLASALFNQEADIFALGLLCYFCLTKGGNPFGSDSFTARFNIVQGGHRVVDARLRYGRSLLSWLYESPLAAMPAAAASPAGGSAATGTVGLPPSTPSFGSSSSLSGLPGATTTTTTSTTTVTFAPSPASLTAPTRIGSRRGEPTAFVGSEATSSSSSSSSSSLPLLATDLIAPMLSLEPEKRLLAMDHPLFWSPRRAIAVISSFADAMKRRYGIAPPIPAGSLPSADWIHLFNDTHAGKLAGTALSSLSSSASSSSSPTNVLLPWQQPRCVSPELTYLEHAFAWHEGLDSDWYAKLSAEDKLVGRKWRTTSAVGKGGPGASAVPMPLVLGGAGSGGGGGDDGNLNGGNGGERGHRGSIASSVTHHHHHHHLHHHHHSSRQDRSGSNASRSIAGTIVGDPSSSSSSSSSSSLLFAPAEEHKSPENYYWTYKKRGLNALGIVRAVRNIAHAHANDYVHGDRTFDSLEELYRYFLQAFPWLPLEVQKAQSLSVASGGGGLND